MQVPVQVVFHGFDRSAAIEAAVQERADKLGTYSRDIVGCRVAIHALQKNQRQGRLYGVTVDLTIPGHELVSNREQNEDVYVAVTDAFNDVKRLLTSALDKDRGDVKAHSNGRDANPTEIAS